MIVLLFYYFLPAAVMLFGAEVNAGITPEPGEPVEEAIAGSPS